jgi:SGF29 tudor-like domain
MSNNNSSSNDACRRNSVNSAGNNSLDLSNRSVQGNNTSSNCAVGIGGNNNNAAAVNFMAAMQNHPAFQNLTPQQQQQRLFQFQMAHFQQQQQQHQHQQQQSSGMSPNPMTPAFTKAMMGSHMSTPNSLGSVSTGGGSFGIGSSVTSAKGAIPNPAAVANNNSNNSMIGNTNNNNPMPAPPLTMLPPRIQLGAPPPLPTQQQAFNQQYALNQQMNTAANASSVPAASAPPPNSTSSKDGVQKSSTKDKDQSKRHPTVSAPPLELDKASLLLKNCNWVDKTLWVSRQLLGGQAVNGFLKSTATVQRIKKQRARQTNKTNAKPEKPPGATEQDMEEILKKQIMNARTAKKMKQELEQGINFCALLHSTIRSIIQEMDPSLPPIELINSPRRAVVTKNPTAKSKTSSSKAGGASSSLSSSSKAAPKSTTTVATTTKTVVKTTSFPPTPTAPPAPAAPEQSPPASAGNPSGSTLRRYRKKKLPPSGEAAVPLPEFDASTGKRTCTKKEYSHRVSEFLRFRTLRVGDPVAARLSSRDLWILARVVQAYPSHSVPPAEFLRLSEARRDQLFKDKKVLIQDVDEHGGGAAAAAATVSVERKLVLPLPRSVSEGAEWTQKVLRKGSRVYAMYPQTTSLYTATVIDSTTYCRGDDDIVVVEFDGDEPDASGKMPSCHIPARFVTLIPREFPGAQPPSAAAASAAAGSGKSNKRRHSFLGDVTQGDPLNGLLDEMDFEGELPGLDGFDDLDFDLLGGS